MFYKKNRNYFLLILIAFLIFFQNVTKAQIDQRIQEPEASVDSMLISLPAIDYEYISTMQGVQHTLPFVKYCFLHPGEIPHVIEAASQSITASKTRISDLSHRAFQMLGASAGGFVPPLSGTVRSVIISTSDELNEIETMLNLKFEQVEEWQKLPFNVRKAIVEIVADLQEAKLVFDQFSFPFQQYLYENGAVSNNEIFEKLMVPWQQRELRDFSSVDIIKKADLKKLSLATRIATGRLDHLGMVQNPEDLSNFRGCSIQSGIGEIRINGPKSDTIRNDYALIIDTGGDDVYMGNTASSASIQQPIGVVVDLSGNDKYIGDKFTAAGIMGIGLLIDLSGDDYYETKHPGLAFSLYGASILYDREGDDTYIARSEYSQASSFIGISILVDGSGDDNYECSSYSQGFGGTLGAGIFFDSRGVDRYNLDEGKEYLPNFIQGAAKGRWAEATDGQSLAGGIGLFIDDNESDGYHAGSFSQGASYYFGLGLFSDTHGDDKYNALSHSQGYATHCSLAGFLDKNGDDVYNANSDSEKITQIIGGGRDFSAGIFIEKEGDDIYHFGNRSAGVGDIKGIGVLADCKGNDRYIWQKNRLNLHSESLGKKAGLNENMNIGFHLFAPKKVSWEAIFFDKEGENVFETH